MPEGSSFALIVSDPSKRSLSLPKLSSRQTLNELEHVEQSVGERNPNAPGLARRGRTAQAILCCEWLRKHSFISSCHKLTARWPKDMQYAGASAPHDVCSFSVDRAHGHLQHEHGGTVQSPSVEQVASHVVKRQRLVTFPSPAGV